MTPRPRAESEAQKAKASGWQPESLLTATQATKELEIVAAEIIPLVPSAGKIAESRGARTSAQVVSITKQRDDAIIEVLEFFLEHAKRGDLRSIEVCVEDINGYEELCVAGEYRDRPAHGAAAALRMSMRLAEMYGGDGPYVRLRITDD